MPVFTAAAIAIATAVATASVATVAAAVVATSIAVGVAGLAVTAVGMVTKNEGLLKAGKIMGYVGMAGGLAGGAIGGLGALSEGGGFIQGATDAFSSASSGIGKAWDNGIGSLFNAGDASAVSGAVEGPANFTPGATNPGINSAAPSTSIDGAAAIDAPTPAVGAPVDAAASAASAPAPVAPVSAAPAAPVTATPAVAPPAAPGSMPAGLFNDGIGGMAGAPAAQPSLLNSISNVPDWVKFSAMTTGAQGLSGAAAGWYQGASAEQRLEFDKLINQQRQNQVQYQNQNNAYAPLLQFQGAKP